MELPCTILQQVLSMLRAIFLQLGSMEGAACDSDPNQWVFNTEMLQRLHDKADAWATIMKGVKRNTACIAGLKNWESAGSWLTLFLTIDSTMFCLVRFRQHQQENTFFLFQNVEKW